MRLVRDDTLTNLGVRIRSDSLFRHGPGRLIGLCEGDVRVVAVFLNATIVFSKADKSSDTIVIALTEGCHSNPYVWNCIGLSLSYEV